MILRPHRRPLSVRRAKQLGFVNLGPGFFAPGAAPGEPNLSILMASMSDSHEDIQADSSSPDLFDGALRLLRAGINNTQPMNYLSWVRPDLEMAFNCGLSGTTLDIWDWTGRPYGRTMNALVASDADLVLLQFNNDIQGGVADAATRDSVAATIVGDYQGAINTLVAAGKKVIWQTTLQRSEAAYGSNALLKQQCCDNSNATLMAWIAATFSPSQVQIADLRAATNLGGAATGAYLDTDFFPDGIHPSQYGVWTRMVPVLKTCVDALFPPRGHTPMARASGANLIASLSTSTCGTTASGTILVNCSISAPDFSLVNGEPAVTYTVTPTGGNGFFSTQILANVGTSGGNTPPSTVASGDKLKGEVFAYIDTGSGGISKLDNFDLIMYASFNGGAEEQRVDNGNLNWSDGGLPVSLGQAALVGARIQTVARTIPAGSEQIGAPSFGNGLRLMPFVFFREGDPTFRVSFVRPAIHKVT